MIRAGFCLGSNLGDRKRFLMQAKNRLLMDSGVKLIAQSAVYETEPVDVKEKYAALKFLNAVLILESPYDAAAWLKKIHAVEAALHRVRGDDRNAPRTVDVDLLFCGDEVIDNAHLQVPHPRWAERRFVVQPLAEICPDLVLPGMDVSVRNVLAKLPDSGDVRRFSDRW
ncbi:MAG: 2-amino-4-hydroxy-6-hydroxymethyldihydropteridine diphosphokinase [Kiritimatiellales bacterium]